MTHHIRKNGENSFILQISANSCNFLPETSTNVNLSVIVISLKVSADLTIETEVEKNWRVPVWNFTGKEYLN